MNGPEIDVIVPSFRSRPAVGATLDSLLAQDVGRDYRITVVDSSDDDTAEWIAWRYPRIRLIRSESRLLPGAARNRGVEAGGGRWLAFIDADAVAHPAWLRKLLERMGQDPPPKLAGGAIDNANPSRRPSRVLYWIEFSQSAPGAPAGIRPQLPSCNWLLRREDFERLGGFDEEAAMSEDQIFCLRLGGGCYFEPAARVAHRHPESWKACRTHLKRLGFWSGRLRSRFDLEGSRWLRRLPSAAYAAAPVRAARIWGRSRRSQAAGPLKTSDLPALLSGLAAWASGLRQGLRANPEMASGDDR